MHIDHDTLLALESAVIFVNTDDPRTGVDSMTTIEAVVDYCVRMSISGERAETPGELRAVRRIRSRVRTLFEAAAADDLTTVVDGINQLIAEADAVPYLIEHDGRPLHLHFTPPDAPLHLRLAADIAMGFAVLLRDDGHQRIRVCASPDCGRALIDLTRNRSRRYCDAQCANRQHVAAYRQRHATTEP